MEPAVSPNVGKSHSGWSHLTTARCFLVVVIAGLAWRLLRYFLNYELSVDEAYILNNVMARGYGELLAPLDYGQVSPPMFLWATKVFDSWFGNEWGVRLLPFLAGLGAMAVFWGLCREVLRGMARWVAWAIFSISWVPVAQSTCAKVYTIDLLVAMLMLWRMLRWLRGGQRMRELLWLGLCAPAFVWLSYTSVFVIGAIGLVLTAHLVKERGSKGWGNGMAGFVFMALAGASAIWLYQVNLRPSLQASLTSGMKDFWRLGYPPLDNPGKIPFWLVQVHTGRGFAWPAGENHFGSTLTCVLWLTGLVVFWRRGNRWVWALFILPHVLSLIASFLQKYPYGADPRICMFLGPGICLFMGAGVQYWLGRFGRERQRLCYRAAALLLLLIAIGGVIREVGLRIREMNRPSIRSTLVQAGRLVGTDGQFVVLPPRGPKRAGGAAPVIFAYYLRRYVPQRIWWHGEIPSPLPSRSNLAVVAVTTEPTDLDSDPFGGFEKRLAEQWGQPITPTWTQAARAQGKEKDRVMVRTYQVAR
jgi:hypothetical protein